VAGCCVHGNERSCFLTCGGFLDGLRNCSASQERLCLGVLRTRRFLSLTLRLAVCNRSGCVAILTPDDGNKCLEEPNTTGKIQNTNTVCCLTKAATAQSVQ
jgi:hypothetical protein